MTLCLHYFVGGPPYRGRGDSVDGRPPHRRPPLGEFDDEPLGKHPRMDPYNQPRRMERDSSARDPYGSLPAPRRADPYPEDPYAPRSREEDPYAPRGREENLYRPVAPGARRDYDDRALYRPPRDEFYDSSERRPMSEGRLPPATEGRLPPSEGRMLPPPQGGRRLLPPEGVKSSSPASRALIQPSRPSLMDIPDRQAIARDERSYDASPFHL